jgi:DNA-binding beta-propeller fold protein YncE
MKNLLALCLLACTALPAQQIPAPTQLPGHPFFVKKTWIIGGLGNWDYLSMDPKANQLFISHGTLVQVVDVTTGAVAGQVTGLREAHAIALDDTGEFGYISDGLADDVKVFDRRSLQVVASIPTGPAPRALALDPQSGLLFAICGVPTSANPSASPTPIRPNGRVASPAPARAPARDTEIKTAMTVIDLQTRRPLATILMPGRLGFAQSDGNGEVYVNIVNRDLIARLDAQAIASLLHSETHETPSLDWTQGAHTQMHIFTLGAGCLEPSSLAVDHSHQRLFAACNNLKLSVLNALTGELVASLPTGPGTDAVGFDPDRGLIYSANGGANGSLTIIRQDVTDSYAVIQNLPTRQRARTLAVNPSTGEVYLVTDLLGVNLAQPGGIGTLHTAPADGSFQVLVVGN